MEVYIMTNYREILRLNKQGISGRGIAASLSCSRNTVSMVIQRAFELNFEWPIPETMTNQKIREAFFPANDSTARYKMPDYDHIHKELAKSGVTLSLLWYEYSEGCRSNHVIPYKYTQFCKLYQDYSLKTKATMRISHKPGEKLEVDWAGKTAVIQDNITGDPIKAYVFVATLPYSGYSYVEAFLSMNMESWIQAHINCFFFFNGVTKILVPDNLKTGVDHVSKSRTVINKTYNEMSAYYDTAVIPARVRRPKDKASAEGTVGVISTWIIAALRRQTFFTLYELNQAIKVKLNEFNTKPFQKKEGSRKSIFIAEEQILLTPLPLHPFELAIWTKATVQFNYHINVNKMNYSVPYEYIKHCVDVRTTSKIVEVFYKSCRIASHVRKFGNPGQYQTLPEHMPEQHQKYQEWNTDRFIFWAQQIGENTTIVIKSILSSYRVEQQGYRSCMALLKSADKYSVQRLENACQRALSYTPNPGYKNVQTILRTGSDKIRKMPEPVKSDQTSKFGITREDNYYGRKDK